MGYLAISLSIVVLIMYIATLLAFIGIKKRMNGNIVRVFNGLIIAIFVLILVRIANLLEKIDVLFVPYLSETLVVLFSIILFTSILFLLNRIKERTDKKRDSFRYIPVRKEKVRREKIYRAPKIRKIKKDKNHHIEREKAQLKKYIK